MQWANSLLKNVASPLVGLATIERSGPLATPRSGDAIARDWLIVNLLHIATVDPIDGARPSRKPCR